MPQFIMISQPSINSTERGQAVIAAVLLAVGVSLLLGLGTATPVVIELKKYQNDLRSKQSFFTAESGVEDVVYRLRHGELLSGAKTLALAGATADLSIVDTPGGKEITAIGTRQNLIRKVAAAVRVGEGVAFHYGVHVGAGGFTIHNNAGINGNIYANGVITGANGAFVTGSAISASAPALAADQVNESPLPPPQVIRFRHAAGAQDFAQSFNLTGTGPLNKASFYLRKSGNPASATVSIVTDQNGLPSTNVLTTGSLSSSQVTNAYGWVEVVFATAPPLEPATTYWLVIDNNSNSSANYYELGANEDYGNGGGKVGVLGGAWTDTSPASLDGYFKIYLGGQTGSIDNLRLGTGGTGDGYARTITNSTATGKLYCQIGGGNNQNCDSSRVDPSPQPFPVSDGNIAVWKNEAEAGGVFTGNYVADGVNSTLGPKKIVGNLRVDNNAVLSLTGTVWVTGTVTVSNNAKIRLSPLYGSNSGVLVADSYITVSNNGTFAGSGEAGSYLMVLTTSDCPASSYCGGNNAITISNNAGTVILNAQKGTISFADNSGTKAVTGYKVTMWNNAVVTYEEGLANQNFTNGPSGGFSIASWGEVE